jgi:ABC-2 type transport system permease protein
MPRLRYYLRIYARCAVQYVKARMQYRDDFIICSIGMVFSCVTTIFVFRILFNTIPNLAGWTFDEILFIYAFFLLSITPVQFFVDNIWFLRYDIISGAFVKYYLKPINILFYYMSERVDVKGFSQLGLGVATLIYASFRLHMDWSPLRILLLGVAWFSASLTAMSILIIAGSTGFWLLGGSLPVLNLAIKIRDFSPYPTTVFTGVFRVLFTFLIPIGFVAFYPSQLFLRPGSAPLLAYLSPFVGIGFFLLAYFIWSKGVDAYAGTGS